MFRSLGYTTEVTPASRDGGYDILLRGRDGVMSIVECTRCLNESATPVRLEIA